LHTSIAKFSNFEGKYHTSLWALIKRFEESQTLYGTHYGTHYGYHNGPTYLGSTSFRYLSEVPNRHDRTHPLQCIDNDENPQHLAEETQQKET
jgi:hypothetical protein